MEYCTVSSTHRVGTPTPLDDETWENIIRKYRRDSAEKLVGSYTINMELATRILHLNISSETIRNAAWFRHPEKTEIVVNDTVLTVQMPHLVFHVSGSILNVYITTEQPKQDTVLYKNPFGNLHGDHVCTGNVKLPKTTIIPDYINRWEDVFLRSRFTSLINSDYTTVKGFEMNLASRGIIMMDKLKKSKLTVKSLFK